MEREEVMKAIIEDTILKHTPVLAERVAKEVVELMKESREAMNNPEAEGQDRWLVEYRLPNEEWRRPRPEHPRTYEQAEAEAQRYLNDGLEARPIPATEAEGMTLDIEKLRALVRKFGNALTVPEVEALLDEIDALRTQPVAGERREPVVTKEDVEVYRQGINSVSPDCMSKSEARAWYHEIKGGLEAVLALRATSHRDAGDVEALGALQRIDNRVGDIASVADDIAIVRSALAGSRPADG